MMTFVHDNHPVVAYHRIDVILFPQRTNHSDVDNARRCSFLRGESANDGITPFDTSLRSGIGRQFFVDGQKSPQVSNPIIHNLDGMYQHQRIDLPTGNQIRAYNRLAEGRRCSEHTHIV